MAATQQEDLISVFVSLDGVTKKLTGCGPPMVSLLIPDRDVDCFPFAAAMTDYSEIDSILIAWGRSRLPNGIAAGRKSNLGC